MAKIRSPRPDGTAHLTFDLPAAATALNSPMTKGA
jgi:hypothetical protein